jgi:translation initiation factor IF-2
MSEEGKAIRLVKVASELNVGAHTVVEHLRAKGFEVDDKPTTKLTEEMYNTLLKDFEKDINIKGKADQIIIGRGKQEVAEAAPVVEKEQPKPKKEEEIFKPEQTKVGGFKVVGTIDLETKKKKKEEVVPPVSAEPEPVKAEKAPEEPTPEPVVEVPEILAPPPIEPPAGEQLFKGVREKLTGIKVMGNIVLPDKPKKKEVPGTSEEEARKKRKRITGKGVDIDKFSKEEDKKTGSASIGGPSTTHRPGGPGGGGGPRRGAPPVRDKAATHETVSEKEIQEKIKATMAKLAGGKGKPTKGKHKKTRKDDEGEGENEGNKVLQVTEFISVSELANLMDVSATQVIAACMGLGVFASINQRLDAEIIELVASEFGFEVKFTNINEEEEGEEVEVEDPASLEHRPPIVTIMGHVDHGKTSLLDYIRSANVIAGEMGGITQHIGAYEVTTEDGRKITFLDTPGHEAFTAMRARGAKLTDIAVIVIAADDNVMPQTKEAIAHAQAAEVPMIFALNKVDKPDSNPEKIKEELSQMNILVEDWGGKFQCEAISAKKGTNIDRLLEKILLEAEMLELKANPNKPAVGSVIEATLDKGRGYVTTIMVQEGTLRIGDVLVAGSHFGKVKAMFNERGQKITAAGPSTPVQMLGLVGAPAAGEKFKVYEDESEAKDIAVRRSTILREQSVRATKHITLDEIGRRLALGNFKELRLIIKGDVDGSVEALADSLLNLSTEEIQISIVYKGVGQISESDVTLASASDAIIVAFQVRPSPSARQLAEREGVEIRNYAIIYDAIEEIKMAMEGMLEPKFEEKVVANVEVREAFKISKVGTIAGCYVTDGKITRNNAIRVIRDGIVVHDGKLEALKRFKDDVRDVAKGFECGIKIKNFNDIQAGDAIEAYEQVELKRKL